MLKQGWKVGLMAAAVCLAGAVPNGLAAPPKTQAPASTADTAPEQSPQEIEQAGHRRMRRIQRMLERERREQGLPDDYDFGMGTPQPDGSVAITEPPPDPTLVAKPANTLRGSTANVSPGQPQPAQPGRAINQAQGSQNCPQYQNGCPTGTCPQGGYPTGYCPAGNCVNCNGCSCKKHCLGHGCKVQPLTPGYIDERDTTYYSAQGYGLPIVVPMAPNVRYQYNYGWGLPSSRLTRVPYGFDSYYPSQFHSMAGSPQVHGEHPPMVYWPTDTTQLGVYGRRVPHWIHSPVIPQ